MANGQKNGGALSRNGKKDGVEDVFHVIKKYKNIIIKKFITIFWLALLALFLGFFLLAISYSLEHESVLHHLSRDFGISFLVAAIVGVALDQLSKLDSNAVDKFKFEENFNTLKRAQVGFDELSDALRESVDPELAIKKNLNQLFSDKKYKPFAESVMNLIHETKEIRNLEENTGTKEIKDYVDMLNWLIKKYAVNNASQFRRLLQALKENERDSVEFTPPDRRDAMLQLLSAQMKSMKKGDRYDSVTNVWLYNNMSDEYISCTENALKSGVTIRRIFNICDAEAPERDRGNIESEKKSIKKQIDRFGHIPGFHYKYLTLEMLNKLDEQIIKHCGISDPKDVKKLFFGHFYHQKTRKMLRFEPDRMKITKIRINVYPFDAKTQDIISFEKLFEHIWEKGESEFPAIAHVADAAGSDMDD